MAELPQVLLVESNILIRFPLADYLRSCGYRVVEAVNSADAKKVVSSGQMKPDLILADAGSEDAEGFGLAHWIRQNFPHIRVVLAGGLSTAAELAGELCEEGPDLHKPYDHHLVERRIRSALGLRSASSAPSLSRIIDRSS
jgi:DNA-binding response OmpR family regulator